LFAFFALAFVAIAADSTTKLRLIEVDGKRFYVHPDKLSKYQAKEGSLVNYIDVTETPDLEKGATGMEKTVFPDRPTQQSTVKPLVQRIDSESQSRLEAVDKHLSSYRTRHAQTDTGVEAVTWIKGEYEKIIAGLSSERRALFTVNLFPHTSWRQPSLIVKMKGSSDEIVILGGHIDSTASGGVAPGADDDASGSSSVLETFRIIATSNYKPHKSVEWHAYAAEEMGLLGSRAIASQYKARAAKVYSMVQLDMTGYGNQKIGVITNGVNPELTAFTRKLITEYGNGNGYVDRTLFGGSSDHASWQGAGYKAAFPFEQQTNPHIHTARDTIDKLNFKHGLEYVKLAASYIVELSHN
jgi:leucyl aminopeptidase